MAEEKDTSQGLDQCPEPVEGITEEEIQRRRQERLTHLEGLERAREELAEELGEDVSAIQVQNENWARILMKRGVIISLTIGRWTARKKLRAQDLGIEDWRDIEDPEARAAVRDFIRLGQKLLLPRRIIQTLDSITTQGRKNLDHYSHNTPWGRFVPAAAYQAWKQRNERLKAQYLAYRDEIVEKLDAIKEELAGKYAHQARIAWLRAHGFDANAESMVDVPQDFVDEYVTRVLSLIPSADYIHQSFKFEARPTYIPLPSLLEEDRLRAERIREQVEADREAEALERMAQHQMEDDIRRYYAEQKRELVDEFLGDVVIQLRGQVYDVVVNVLRSMQTNQGKLVGKASTQLQNLIEWSSQLNFYGDQEITQAVALIRQELARDPRERDLKDIERKLKALATVTRGTLMELGAPPRSARAVGIEDVVEVEAVRQARETLGTEDIPELGIVRQVRAIAQEEEVIALD